MNDVPTAGAQAQRAATIANVAYRMEEWELTII